MRSGLWLWRERPDFGLPLRIGQGTELGCHAAGDRRCFTARLETGEIRPVAPGNRAAETHASLDGRVVHDVDHTLIVWRTLPEPREVAEVAARGEKCRHAGTFAISSAFFRPSSVSIIKINTMLSLAVLR